MPRPPNSIVLIHGLWMWPSAGKTGSVDFHNNDRAPLLLISGGKDHVSPASVVEANFKLYGKSTALTTYKEFPERTHFTVGQDGWEEVADYALEWAVSHSSATHTANKA